MQSFNRPLRLMPLSLIKNNIMKNSHKNVPHLRSCKLHLHKRCITVIVAENGISESSSNHGQVLCTNSSEERRMDSLALVGNHSRRRKYPISKPCKRQQKTTLMYFPRNQGNL